MVLLFFLIIACYNPYTVETFHNINNLLVSYDNSPIFENFEVNPIAGGDKLHNILNTSHHSSEEEDDKLPFGGKPEHIELAYRLCSDPHVKEPKCHGFRKHFDALKRSYNELKSDYCSKHNHVCQELGL